MLNFDLKEKEEFICLAKFETLQYKSLGFLGLGTFCSKLPFRHGPDFAAVA